MDKIFVKRIIGYLKNELTQDEIKELFIELQTDSKKKIFFDDLSLIWQNSANTDIPDLPDDYEAYRKFMERVTKIKDSKPLKTINLRKVAQIAAVIFCLIVFGGVLKYYFLDKDNLKEKIILTGPEIKPGDPKKVTLCDGSEVWLNSSSQIEYADGFKKNKRELILDGEAFFNIAPDSERPFYIHAKGAIIKVLGTSFNISAYDNDSLLVVAVFTGKVNLYNTNQTSEAVFVISSGQQGIFSCLSGLIKVENTKNENMDSWKTGKLAFTCQPLKSVIETLEKYYGEKIIINNTDLMNEMLTSSFDNQALEEVMQVIALTMDIKYHKEMDMYILSK